MKPGEIVLLTLPQPDLSLGKPLSANMDETLTRHEFSVE